MNLTAKESHCMHICGSALHDIRNEWNEKKKKIKITTKLTHFISFRIHKYWVAVQEIRFVDLIKQSLWRSQEIVWEENEKEEET